jgi:uncharacterized membrane protein YjjP (DUF1212 family)
MNLLEKITNDEIKTNENSRILNNISKYFNYKTALFGAGFMGLLVFGINYYGSEDLSGSSIAAIKQAAYSGLSGGVLIKISKNFAIKYKNKALSLSSAIILPVLITTSLTYGIHKYIKESPKPIASTIPTTLIISTFASLYAPYIRKKHYSK